MSCEKVRAHAGGARFAAGRAAFRGEITGSVFSRVFLAALLPGLSLTVLVREDDLAAAEYDDLIGRVARAQGLEGLAGGLFARPAYGFDDLIADERQRLLAAVPERRRAQWDAVPALSLDQVLPLLEEHRKLELDAPGDLAGQAETALEDSLAECARGFLSAPARCASEASAMLARAQAAGLPPVKGRAQQAWLACLWGALDGLEREPTEAGVGSLRLLVELLRKAGFSNWHFRAETRFFVLSRGGRLPACPDLTRLAELLGVALEPWGFRGGQQDRGRVLQDSSAGICRSSSLM